MKTNTILLSLIVIISLGTAFYVVLQGQAKEVSEEQVKTLLNKIDNAKDIQSLNSCAKEIQDLGEGASAHIKKLMSEIDIHAKVFIYKVFYNWGETEFAIDKLMFIMRNYSKSARARILAANVLAQVGSSELETQLISALEIEEDQKVRVAIADCLYATCKETKKSITELEKGVKSSDRSLSKEAVFALARAGRVQLVEDEIKRYIKLPNTDGMLARLYIKGNRLRIALEEAMLPRKNRPDTHDYAENEKPANGTNEEGDPEFSSAIYDELLLKIQKKYLDEAKTEKTDLLMDTARKMLDMLDPYSAYIHDNKELEDWQKTLDQKYPGIGVELGSRNGLIFVISSIKGSPAYNAGIRAMDLVSKIDDMESYKLSLLKAELMLRGEPKTSVEMEVMRVGWYVPRTYTIKRESIKLPEISYKMLPANIGFVEIPYFSDTAGEQFRNALEKLKEQGAKGYILDVRNCPGGDMQAAINCADMLLPKDDLIAYTKGQNPTLGAKTDFISENDPIVTEPVKILVNYGTSDAAEIFAGSLSKNERAKLVAERWVSDDSKNEIIKEFNKETDLKKKGVTFGKAIKQQIIPMKSTEIKNSALNLTVAYYYLKDDARIQGIGLYTDNIIWRSAIDGWIMNEFETPRIDAILNSYIEDQVNQDKFKMIKLADYDSDQLTMYPESENLIKSLKTRANSNHIRFRLREKIRKYLTENKEINFDSIVDLQEDETLLQAIIRLAKDLKINLSDNKELSKYFE